MKEWTQFRVPADQKGLKSEGQGSQMSLYRSAVDSGVRSIRIEGLLQVCEDLNVLHWIDSLFKRVEKLCVGFPHP